jgi:hypothetical protein
VRVPRDDDGLGLELTWEFAQFPPDPVIAVWRSSTGRSGNWTLIADNLPVATTTYSDRVTTDPRSEPPALEYWYMVTARTAGSPGEGRAPDGKTFPRSGSDAWPTGAVSASPQASLLKTSPGPLLLLAIILSVGTLMLWFASRARRGGRVAIRRIPGIDAIEEGIGRATEMGRPVLYVPGIDELQDIQTIASMLILGQVARTVAEYQSDLIVTCCIPIVREVADEVVKAGFFQAGHPDAHKPTNVRFISSEQFAFCAGTNGIIYREKPATNIFLGRFFGESLILAETGFVNKSIQIAGTAEATQLPFFVAACDYTLIGEELFACSAYLSRDPRLVSSLKASDWIKLFVLACLAAGTVLMTIGSTFLRDLFVIASG